jgi:iron complex transport system substrate-binding protein
LVLVGIAVCAILLTSPVLASAGYSKIYGNANEDDVLDMRDVTYIKLAIFGKKPATDFADANYDGKISMLDIGQTKLIILGKEKKLTLVDVSDRIVTVPRPVEEVVSLSIDDLRTLTALGVVDKIVARPDYVDKYANTLMPVQAHPEIKEIPNAGPYKDPSLELIVSLKPDVIFAYGGSAAYTAIANEIQDKACISVVCVKHSTESGYRFNFEAFELVGKVIGKEERAEELISYANDEIAKVSEITSDIPDNEKSKVYFFSAQGATFIERAVPCYGPIDLAGGINVAEELPGCSVVEVSIEQIIIWNPDIILIHCFSKDPEISVVSYKP